MSHYIEIVIELTEYDGDIDDVRIDGESVKHDVGDDFIAAINKKIKSDNKKEAA